jgi:hypothetical protein
MRCKNSLTRAKLKKERKKTYYCTVEVGNTGHFFIIPVHLGP